MGARLCNERTTRPSMTGTSTASCAATDVPANTALVRKARVFSHDDSDEFGGVVLAPCGTWRSFSTLNDGFALRTARRWS